MNEIRQSDQGIEICAESCPCCCDKKSKLRIGISVTETEVFKDMVKLLKELHETSNDEQKEKIERFIGEKLETNRG